MRKKFCSILLLICFLVNMFAGVAFAGNDSKQISLRVEGIDGTILEETSYRTEAPSVYEAVYEILQDYNIPLEVAETSSVKYIFSINGEEAGTFGGYDGWLYMVNNEIPDEAMDARPIYDGDEIVLYYGEYPPGTYVPTVELSQETVEAGTGFTVTVTSTYYDWDQMTEVTVSLKDVEINLSGETYYTDDNGEAVITVPMVPGDYSLKISLDRDDSFPLIVRTTKNITVTEAAEAPRVAKGHVVVSVEKFTLGQGYLIEPMVFPFYEGDNGASLITNVLTEYLGENSYRHTGTIEKSFYLASVKDDSSDPLNIPQYILEALDYEPDENDREEGWLGEFDYTSDSGWMYAVNGVFLGNGFSDYSPKDGDVVRVQFTLYGYGADLGAVSEWGQEPLISVADKDALTARIAEINSAPDKNEILADPLIRQAYDHAYQVLANMESTQESVDEALLNLEKTLNGEDPEIDTVQLAREHLADSLAFLYESTPEPTFGTLGGEWSILALARGGYEVPEGYYDIYYNNVVNEVKRLMPASGSKPEGKLDRNKGTEHSRLILGLTSIGKDITNVGGYDIRQALADYNYVIRQGINGPIFALIAFDSHNYDIPVVEGVSVQSTRDMWINYILDKEISKGTATAGGWALSGNTPDPDITAMAIQALTPYYGRSDVKGAVDRAISWLSNAQDADGGYSSWGSANIESIAQVVVALTGLGIDPHTDSRFIKNGHSAIEALLTYAIPGGGFKHVQSGSVDGMATDQGTYALVAYIRFLDGENSLYDMTDVELETKQPGEPGEPGKPEEPETPGQPAENGNGKNPKSNKYVTLSIDKLTIKKGYVLRPTQVEFEEGETVWDVTKRVMDSRGIAYTYVETPKYNSVYVEWIDGDGEFDHGDGSGWMYSVNGWYPNYGSSLYKLRDGDVVQWRYTTNLGADLGQDITKWERPTISVKGIKNNQKVSARELTFQVTAKDANGKSLIPTVKLNGKTVTGKNGEYTVKLAEGENIITITAIDGEGNRAGETYTVTYNPPKTANTQVPSSVNGPQTGNRTIETGSTVTTARSLEEMYADFNAISPWAREAVEKATKNGFVTGFDGKFNPQANVTRAEFTKMMVSVLGLNLNTVKAITFADV